ncbi:hypothetical protein CGRA01v4_03152 [Colletotrichum graminicola]|nr:hypothetical protein CGRA01v4_03152 [Colletotrichum graminicola]
MRLTCSGFPKASPLGISSLEPPPETGPGKAGSPCGERGECPYVIIQNGRKNDDWRRWQWESPPYRITAEAMFQI